MNTKSPLKSIVDAWHSECAEIRLSERGTPMPIINPARMLESLKILAKTLLHHGYTYEEVDSVRVSMLIVDKCWKEDQIKKMSTVDVRKAKKNLADTWDSVIHSKEFSGIEIATLDEDEKVVAVQKTEYKKEEPTKEDIFKEIMNPKDRIVSTQKIDRSADTNWELMEELGIVLDGSENE